MPRPKKSAAAPSAGSPAARPDIRKLAAEAELDAEKTDVTPDVPEPGASPDARERCPHGRLFKCGKCDEAKAEERELANVDRKRERLASCVHTFHKAAFDMAAILAGDDRVRLTDVETKALGDSGSIVVEELAPNVSLTVIALLGYGVSLSGVVAGKVLDTKKPEKKDDGQSAPARGGDKANGQDDPRATVPQIRM